MTAMSKDVHFRAPSGRGNGRVFLFYGKEADL